MHHYVTDADGFFERGLQSLSVPGQNEKDIWVDPRTSHEYIAKRAGKNGRTETITEYMLNIIGQRLGLRMAEPSLGKRRGELRFMSKKFHGSRESLMHGHEFLAQFWSPEEIAAIHRNSREERRLYSIRNVVDGFEAAYMQNAHTFTNTFLKMLLFDATVGCQDRHPKNWGIVRSVTGAHQDRFAPIFDTARGLFWEFSSSQLKALTDDDLARYVRRSRPPIGDFDGQRVTHFELVKQILCRYPECKPVLKHMVSVRKEESVCAVLDGSFGAYLSKWRGRQIRRCLQARFATLRQLAASN